MTSTDQTSDGSGEPAPPEQAVRPSLSLFGRLSRHLRDQHWAAIGIELVVVVFGVFLGFQLTTWNEARLAREDYEQALARLSVEIDTNLAGMKATREEAEARLPVVERAIEVLQTCEESPENVAAVNAAVDIARATNGIRVRRIALDELATSPRLLAQQSATERQRIADMSVYFDLIEGESAFMEDHPLSQRIEHLDVLTLGAPRRLQEVYEGRELTKVRFPLILKSGIADTCRDDALMKVLFTWYRWQSNLPVFSNEISAELEATRAVLAARR